MRKSGRLWKLAWPLAILAGGCCSLPAYNPGFWNDAGQVQFHNNCYNYSNNKRTDTFAQPGLAAGAEYTALTCDAVKKAAGADGIPLLPAWGGCQNSRDKIALVVAPGIDFHWYRQGTDGMWTHKPGGTAATNVDNSGHTISNPETANRGIYTDFCGYFCSCSDSKEGNGHENIK